MSGWLIFADGASSGNPGPGGWGAVVISPQIQGVETVAELGGGAESTTNNQMELEAVTQALRWIQEKHPKNSENIEVCTDSSYVTQGISQWIHGWRARGWETLDGKPVANRERWETLDSIVKTLGNQRIQWTLVKGHAGILGNECADQIAVSFRDSKPPRLYHGPITHYAHPEIRHRRQSTALNEPVYLSYLDGKLVEHSTWAECEARVKGKNGVKFKKIKTEHEREQTLRAWGLLKG